MTADRVPSQWLSDGSTDGVFVVDSTTNARFMAADGTTLAYTLAKDFIALECAIGGADSDVGTSSSLVSVD